jgi:hypothetical protein
MKFYECITEYIVEDVLVMSPGDRIVIEDDNLYNITTGISYTDIPNISDVLKHVKAVDEITQVEIDADKFETITHNMLDTFKRKNHDYGNSFEESLNEEGLAASRIRMGDKWNRYKTLSKGTKNQVNDESIRDTLLDLANYAIMTVMWLDKNE